MKKRHCVEQIIAMLRQADMEPGKGLKLAESGRGEGLT